MSDFPDKIVIDPRSHHYGEKLIGQSIAEPHSGHWPEYIRLDIAQAMVAAAYEAAAQEAHDLCMVGDEQAAPTYIRALTPDDAAAALARRDATMKAEGMRDAAGHMTGVFMRAATGHDGFDNAYADTLRRWIDNMRSSLAALADKTEKGETT